MPIVKEQLINSLCTCDSKIFHAFLQEPHWKVGHAPFVCIRKCVTTEPPQFWALGLKLNTTEAPQTSSVVAGLLRRWGAESGGGWGRGKGLRPYDRQNSSSARGSNRIGTSVKTPESTRPAGTQAVMIEDQFAHSKSAIPSVYVLTKWDKRERFLDKDQRKWTKKWTFRECSCCALLNQMSKSLTKEWTL